MSKKLDKADESLLPSVTRNRLAACTSSLYKMQKVSPSGKRVILKESYPSREEAENRRDVLRDQDPDATYYVFLKDETDGFLE